MQLKRKKPKKPIRILPPVRCVHFEARSNPSQKPRPAILTEPSVRIPFLAERGVLKQACRKRSMQARRLGKPEENKDVFQELWKTMFFFYNHARQKAGKVSLAMASKPVIRRRRIFTSGFSPRPFAKAWLCSLLGSLSKCYWC